MNVGVAIFVMTEIAVLALSASVPRKYSILKCERNTMSITVSRFASMESMRGFFEGRGINSNDPRGDVFSHFSALLRS